MFRQEQFGDEFGQGSRDRKFVSVSVCDYIAMNTLYSNVLQRHKLPLLIADIIVTNGSRKSFDK